MNTFKVVLELQKDLNCRNTLIYKRKSREWLIPSDNTDKS